MNKREEKRQRQAEGFTKKLRNTIPGEYFFWPRSQEESCRRLARQAGIEITFSRTDTIDVDGAQWAKVHREKDVEKAEMKRLARLGKLHRPELVMRDFGEITEEFMQQRHGVLRTPQEFRQWATTRVVGAECFVPFDDLKAMQGTMDLAGVKVMFEPWGNDPADGRTPLMKGRLTTDSYAPERADLIRRMRVYSKVREEMEEEWAQERWEFRMKTPPTPEEIAERERLTKEIDEWEKVDLKPLFNPEEWGLPAEGEQASEGDE